MKKNVHVVHHKDGNNWQVKYEHDETPLAMFDTKEEAIQNGREIAMENESELVIHRMDGEITEKWSYGNDPRNVKG